MAFLPTNSLSSTNLPLNKVTLYVPVIIINYTTTEMKSQNIVLAAVKTMLLWSCISWHKTSITCLFASFNLFHFMKIAFRLAHMSWPLKPIGAGAFSTSCLPDANHQKGKYPEEAFFMLSRNSARRRAGNFTGLMEYLHRTFDILRPGLIRPSM